MYLNHELVRLVVVVVGVLGEVVSDALGASVELLDGKPTTVWELEKVEKIERSNTVVLLSLIVKSISRIPKKNILV